ncbi:MAG: hypothetical protein HKM04_06810 [Legionellales bacterium]|nr:hypothetical protein [Legionellales bacterium]
MARVQNEIEELRQNTDADIIKFDDLKKQLEQEPRTAKELIDDPSNPFTNIDDISKAKKYNVLFSGKGGDKNISLVMISQLDGHNVSHNLFEARNIFLESDRYARVC